MTGINDETTALTKEEKTAIALQMARNYIERMPKTDSDGVDCTSEALQVIAAIEDLDFDTTSIVFQIKKDPPYVDFREASTITEGPVLFGYRTSMLGHVFPLKYTGSIKDLDKAVSSSVLWVDTLPESDWNLPLNELAAKYPVELNGTKNKPGQVVVK